MFIKHIYFYTSLIGKSDFSERVVFCFCRVSHGLVGKPLMRETNTLVHFLESRYFRGGFTWEIHANKTQKRGGALF